MTCTRRVARIVQIHPTRRCNLMCRHCYSESGPRMADELRVELLSELVSDAAAEGYNYLALSGGEPLMWHGLWGLLEAARAAGMTATLTTNATLVTLELARRLAAAVPYVAVSIDGSSVSHERMRGKGTFVRMLRGVSILRSAGVPIGLIWTLTQSNSHELADVYSYAQQVGAAFVQVHPLENAGYAAEGLGAEIPDADELLVAGLFASELCAGKQGEIPIYLDAASSAALAEQVVPAGYPEAPLSRLVDPLVVRPDGLVVPGNYALPPAWALGRLSEAPLSTLLERWRARGLSEWKELINATLVSLPGEETLVNFGARLLVTAQRLAARSDA